MKNSERAEKILEITDRWDMKPVDMLAFITAQLDEAIAEARVAMREENFYAQSLDQKYQQGFASAREKAAGIAESPIINYEGCEPKECYECDCHGEIPQKYIAERIRGMSHELIPRR